MYVIGDKRSQIGRKNMNIDGMLFQITGNVRFAEKYLD